MISLREFEPSDIGLIVNWSSRPEALDNTDFSDLIGDESEAYFSQMLSNRNSMQYIIQLDADPIGYIGMNRQPDDWWKLQVVIAETHLRGKGFGPEAIKLLISKVGYRGISKVFADVEARDTRTIRAFEKANFVSMGVEQHFTGGSSPGNKIRFESFI